MSLTPVVNTFAGTPLERWSERRGDPAWIAGLAAGTDARWVVFREGRPLLEDGQARLARLEAGPARALADAGGPELFLAVAAGGPVFAVEARAEADGAFTDLRAVAGELPEEDAALAATARAVFAWHRRHGFCANCGAATAVTDAGWKRVCPACAAQHFPRTDPVVIMLAVRGDRCLLGRGAAWPEGRYSALAGFLEPGESIEAACARELKEESGLSAVQVTYHSSQPWPLSPLGGQL
jgi:NAD+ diphosphatase